MNTNTISPLSFWDLCSQDMILILILNLDDVVCNADLYIANQEDFTQGAISQS